MTKRLLSVVIVLLSNLNIQSNLCFAARRDVQDPVLREIINEFGNKIPKFTNKYGDNVFVQDGSVTRGDLIIALYEYDKKTKGLSSVPDGMNTQITKNEFESLKNKVTALEKNGRLPSGQISSKNKEHTNIIEIIADLEPNMPMILDNSLKYSKVFNELQQKVKDGVGNTESSLSKSSSISKKELTELKETLYQLQSDYVSLSKRLDKLNSSLPESERSDKNNNLEMIRLSKQLNEMKKTINPSGNVSSSGNDRNTGKVAGVSLGLSMIAALFVARQ
ncbi:MAG: hypothetical protein LBD61_00420 [Endomicrobium sp.]|jgi:hypothetical protein|nr:hypothetical protein [Endomicrobium sp.]